MPVLVLNNCENINGLWNNFNAHSCIICVNMFDRITCESVVTSNSNVVIMTLIRIVVD